MTHRPHVIFIGPPASGKSRVGKRVARILGCEFIDTDRAIVAEHGPIPEIFADHGEAQFRAWERDAVAHAVVRPAVVSLGGGAVQDEVSRRLVRGHRVVQLSVSEEAVAERLTGDKRPLLASGSSAERVAKWRELVNSRKHHYDEVTRATWDTSSRPLDLIAEEIARWATSEPEFHPEEQL